MHGKEKGMELASNSLGGQTIWWVQEEQSQNPHTRKYPTKELLSFIFFIHVLFLHKPQMSHTCMDSVSIHLSFQLLCKLLRMEDFENAFAIWSTQHLISPHHLPFTPLSDLILARNVIIFFPTDSWKYEFSFILD